VFGYKGKEMIEPSNLHKCDTCESSLFKIQIDDEYDMLLYECYACGYIHSHWFREDKN
jgi:Zn ribbon nucleic-acid-binding protein